MKNLPPDTSFSQLKAAFSAMKAPYPHDRSPALALQIVYEDTKFTSESDDMWIERFLGMDPRAINRIEASLIPIPGEFIRISWYQNHGAELLLCHFFVWRGGGWDCLGVTRSVRKKRL